MNHPVIRTDLLRVHVENAALLARQRMLLTEAPHARVTDIYETDQRVGGNFRYLQLAGPIALDMAAEVFATTPELGEAIVFAALSMTAGREAYATEIVAQMQDDEAALAALSEAFRYAAHASQRAAFYTLVRHDHPVLVSAGLAAATMMRLGLKDMLASFLTDKRFAVQAAALEHAGVMGLVQHAPRAIAAIGHPHAGLAFAGAVASLRLGSPQAAQALIESIASLPPARARLAVEVGFPQLAQDVAQAQVRVLLGNPATLRWGLLALGVIGSTRTLPYLLHHMADPATSRMAGWAFAMITGANVAEDDLELDEFPQLDDDPLLEGAAEELFFEDGLPFPDHDRVLGWIKDKGTALSPEHPLLFGLPQWTLQDMDSPDLEFQARYRALAQLIAVRHPERRLPDWRAPLRIAAGKLSRDWQA